MFLDYFKDADQIYLPILAGVAVLLFIHEVRRMIQRKAIYNHLCKYMHRFANENWLEGSESNDTVSEIVAFILDKLIDGMDDADDQIYKHAMKHAAILYHNEFYIPFSVTDTNLYMALDQIKEKFYRTYGTYAGPEKHNGRNDFRIGFRSKKFPNLFFFFDGRTEKELKQTMENLWIDDYEGHGSRIVITLSILMPWARPKYNYRYHC